MGKVIIICVFYGFRIWKSIQRRHVEINQLIKQPEEFVVFKQNLALRINSKTTANSISRLPIVSKLHFEICRLYQQSVYSANYVMETIRVIFLNSERNNNIDFIDWTQVAGTMRTVLRYVQVWKLFANYRQQLGSLYLKTICQDSISIICLTVYSWSRLWKILN